MIDRDSNTPIYIQIYEDLKQQILQNGFQEDFLPSERILSEKYDVERATLRRALKLLVMDNLIIKVPGSGSKINRQLLTNKTNASLESKNIAFILPDESSDKIYQPFVAALFYDFEKECRRQNLNLFYTQLKSEHDMYDRLFQTDVKGIVWVSKVDDALVWKAIEMNIPSVCVSNYIPGVNSVLCDNYAGSYAAVKHLLDYGHKKIGYINGIPNYLNAIERYTGYISTLNQYDLYDGNLVREGNWTFESGYEAALDLISKNPDITAIFAANDMMALGAIKAIQKSGLHVPDDISVIGFDNINQGLYSSPALTTIEVNIKTFAKETFKVLTNLIEDNNSSNIKVLIPASLVIRESTKKIGKS